MQIGLSFLHHFKFKERFKILTISDGEWQRLFFWAFSEQSMVLYTFVIWQISQHCIPSHWSAVDYNHFLHLSHNLFSGNFSPLQPKQETGMRRWVWLDEDFTLSKTSLGIFKFNSKLQNWLYLSLTELEKNAYYLISTSLVSPGIGCHQEIQRLYIKTWKLKKILK